MKMSTARKSWMSSIRIPIAPPGKVMLSSKDYYRKKQKTEVRKDIEKQEREMVKYV